MWLVGTFDPILEVAAFVRKQLYYLVGTLRSASTKMGYITDRLSNFEPIAAHDVLDSLESAVLSRDYRLTQRRRESALALCKPCRPAAARARLTAGASDARMVARCPRVGRNHGQHPLVRRERGTKRRLLVAEL